MSCFSHPFVKFVLVGLVNTANYYIVYLILLTLGLPYLASHITGFLAAFVVSYFLNCYYVYQVQPTVKTFLQFPLTQVVNMGLQSALLYVFVALLHISPALAPFPALIITVPVTYVLSKKILVKESS
ncbi:GtrA family protein [Macrococcus equipercicus]|uniref:GtrA family protein n=1 Tax=Macrococcus equipercicus TaxID=69967 RepID=A0A9Q9BV13_9STAP|nr:GtrA family protein [Macrococcus equipercicus]KAA1036948.1 GtrA family protein [Macrococcus equipercicus]UTH14661.1 GtrA family protein [Macrococcus equipercicus]